jgi:hypothetical protein
MTDEENDDTLLLPAIRRLHSIGITGKGITVGHLDTGIDLLASGLPLSALQEFRFFDELGHSAVAPPHDTAAHGSATARVLHRLAPEAKIVSGVVFDGGHVHARLLAGMNWLLEESVDIVLMSLGLPYETTLFERTLSMFANRGILCVVASGNSGTGKKFSPAWSSNVLTVGSVGESGLPEVYSSCIEVDKVPVKPEILTRGSIANHRGTSIAASCVAGFSALIRQALPDATLTTMRHIFAASCTPLTAMSYKARHGIIDVDRIADFCTKQIDIPPAMPSTFEIRVDAPRVDESLRSAIDRGSKRERVFFLVFLKDGVDALAFQRTLREDCAVIWLLRAQGILFCEAAVEEVKNLITHRDVQTLHSGTL